MIRNCTNATNSIARPKISMSTKGGASHTNIVRYSSADLRSTTEWQFERRQGGNERLQEGLKAIAGAISRSGYAFGT